MALPRPLRPAAGTPARAGGNLPNMRFWLLAGLMVIGGCVWRAAESATLALHVPGETRAMQLSAGGEVSGQSFQLRPTAGGYRGTAGAAVVDLNSSGEKITGVVGDRIVDLHVRVEGDEVHANGLFAGELGRLDAGPQAIFGYVGRCRYDLRDAGARFEGTRTCGGTYPASLDLPRELANLPADRRAMLLALLLSDPFRGVR
jgi:hypothetical protein